MGASQRDETAGGKRGGADRHQNQTSHRAFSISPRVQVGLCVVLFSRRCTHQRATAGVVLSLFASCPRIQTNSRQARLDPVVSENAKGAGSGYQQMSD